MIKDFLDNNKQNFYFVFRILIGILFILHGWMKLGAITSGSLSLMSLAFLIEVVGGLFIVIGYMVQWTALIAGIEMIFAYFMAHVSGGLSPLVNKGEPAVLFFAAFLVLATMGAGKWAVDKK